MGPEGLPEALQIPLSRSHPLVFLLKLFSKKLTLNPRPSASTPRPRMPFIRGLLPYKTGALAKLSYEPLIEIICF